MAPVGAKDLSAKGVLSVSGTACASFRQLIPLYDPQLYLGRVGAPKRSTHTYTHAHLDKKLELCCSRGLVVLIGMCQDRQLQHLSI